MLRTTDLTTAVEHALRAPSVHNSQPWLWRIRAGAIELYADGNRHLIATDPDRRDLVISCGAALHHLQVALAAQDLAVDVDRMPDPDDSSHLATITIAPGTGNRVDAAQAAAIASRRTDRRQLSHRPVDPEQLQDLIATARRAGALLVPATGTAMRQRLGAALVDAAHRQRTEPGYAAELQLWTHRTAGAHDGISAASVAPAPTGLIEPSPLRHFPGGQLSQPHQHPGNGPADDAAELLVILTPHDGPIDWLRAGEATSAVLLAATMMGLATTPLSQALEITASRLMIQREVFRVPEHAQLIVRAGWPSAGAAQLPVTPRRPVNAVLLPN